MEGWTKPIPVGVKVRVATTLPELKLSSGTINVYAEPGKITGVPMQLRPKTKGATLANIGVTALVPAPTGQVNTAVYTAQGGYTVRGFDAATGALKSGKLLLWATVKGGVTVPLVVTVKILPATTKLTLSTSPKTLTLNPNLTGGENAV